MKMSVQRLVVGLTCAMTMAFGAVGSAMPPAKRAFEFVLVNEPLVSCGSFDIIENSTTTFDRTIFFDSDGNRTRVQLVARFFGTFTNSATGASFIDGPDPQLIVIDFGDGTLTNSGLPFHIKLPGGGAVVVNAGTVVIDNDGNLTIHGPHTVLENGLESLCGLLDH